MAARGALLSPGCCAWVVAQYMPACLFAFTQCSVGAVCVYRNKSIKCFVPLSQFTFSMVDTMTLRQFLDAVPWEAAEPEMVNEIEAVLLNNRITARPLHPARKPALMFLVSGPGAPS